MKIIIMADANLANYFKQKFAQQTNIEITSSEQYEFQNVILIPVDNFNKLFKKHEENCNDDFFYILHSSDFYPKDTPAGKQTAYCTKNRTVYTFHRSPQDKVFSLLTDKTVNDAHTLIERINQTKE